MPTWEKTTVMGVIFLLFLIGGLQARDIQGPEKKPDIAGLVGLAENRDSQKGVIREVTSIQEDTTNLWFDDVESGAGEWTLETGWEITESSYYSPTHSFRIDDDNYSTISNLLTPAISLTEIASDEEIHFSFALWCNFPDFDGDGDNSLEDYYRVSVADMSSSPWHTSTFDAYDQQSWWCGDESLGGYGDGWLQFLDTPDITIPGSGCILRAQMKWAIEDPEGAGGVAGHFIDGWDAANVRISTDDGSTWEILIGSDPYDFYSGYGWVHNGEPDGVDGVHTLASGWGGQAGWHEVTFDLNAYADSTVQIRFAFGSDPAYSTIDDPRLVGFFVDNVLVMSGIDTLFSDNADDLVYMTPQGLSWETVFYDYGDLSRPGGLGWEVYLPGMPYNGNVQLDLSHLAGSTIKLKWTAIIDGDDNGGNGQGLFIDDVYIWQVGAENPLPPPIGLQAEAGDGFVDLVWNDLNQGGVGEWAYDDGEFENTIYMTSGTGLAGTYFNSFANSTVQTVKIWGQEGFVGATTVTAYNASFGDIETTPAYSTNFTLQANMWNEIDVSALGWNFSGDFVVAFEINATVGVALDESSIPSSHSYIMTGTVWVTWQSAAGDVLPDGEWGIRVVADSDPTSITYNLYRSTESGNYDDPLVSDLVDTTYHDATVANYTEYFYVVTAVYDDLGESPFSGEVSATPEPQTTYEIAYDDGIANVGYHIGSPGNFLAVRFSPDSCPVTLRQLKYYVHSGTGNFRAKVWDDDGTDGIPGTELFSTNFSGATEGWNIQDVAGENITITEGDFYVGWKEMSTTPLLGADSDPPFDDRSWYGMYVSADSTDWGLLSGLGLNYDLMIRVVVDTAQVGVPHRGGTTAPRTYTLKQNHPNPFNAETLIHYTIPEKGRVVLGVYNLMGQRVAVLADGFHNPGFYTVTFDGLNLASGLYFYRIEAEGFSAAKKMVLMR